MRQRHADDPRPANPQPIPTSPVLRIPQRRQQRWPEKSAQHDKWNFCLKAAKIAADQIALDGTQYYRSNKVSCPHCSTRQHSCRSRYGNGKTEYHHDMLAATLVAPGHNRVVPLIPEFIVPQDGHEKQDCESRAARCWLAAHGARYAPLDPVFLVFPSWRDILETLAFVKAPPRPP